MIQTVTALAFVLACLVMAEATPGESGEMLLDIGGPYDALFLRGGWGPAEGPYSEFGEIWRSRCRWANQGATVRIPVVPGVTNVLTLRAGLSGGPEQRLRLFVNDRAVGEFPVSPEPELEYRASVDAGLLEGKRWATLRIETQKSSVPRSEGDRDFRVAVDWIKVSAEGPARDFIKEELDRRGVLEGTPVGSPPSHWKFFCDANAFGDRQALVPYYAVFYDDSAWDVVASDHRPPLLRGQAAWYRAWMLVSDGGEQVRSALRLPGRGLGDEMDCRVWVNGRPVEGEDLGRAAAAALVPGANLIAVRLLQGPFDRVTGDDLAEPPAFSGRYSDGRVFVSLSSLIPRSAAADLRCRLFSPSHRDLGEMRVGEERELTEFGRHSLVVEDAAGRRQVFPLYHLGIHFFHWGWYSAWDGTRWSGFTPTSNDYVDQLFARKDEWQKPHHSISWGGAIFAPGTGFHATQGGDYPEKFRRAFAGGSLSLVGMPFAPRNICADFGESLIRGIRRSLDIYESVLRTRPSSFASHDSTLTPLLPQILRLTGYDALCMAENWWGERSDLNSRDCYWESFDGARIRVFDSPYHGMSVSGAVELAIRQGKPAVFCSEEFACLDSTLFLNEEEWHSLARRGILLKPVSLEEYRRITDDFAGQVIHRGDDGLCYKGWTGGSEGETEFEKAARSLETHLVALENLQALAALFLIQGDRSQLDALWDFSLRLHECHMHFGNGVGREGLAEFARRIESVQTEMEELARRIVGWKTPVEGVTVFNPLGFRRRALIRLKAPEGTRSLVPALGEGRPIPVQPDPENQGNLLASVPDLPSIGCRGYTFSAKDAGEPEVGLDLRDGSLLLDNGLIRVHIGADAGVKLLEDVRTGQPLLRDAHVLYFSRPHDSAPDEPLSSVMLPLNLDHYVRPAVVGGAKRVCQGPVMAAADLDLAVPGYPNARIVLRVSLVRGERMVRFRLMMQFSNPTTICPVDADDPHEGTYLPGIFCAFPMDARDRPVADMAYCLTENVLSSTNHDTFLSAPFRNGTFNALTLAGPSKGSYSVLTRGLNDFFIVRRPDGMLALSFGTGTAGFPYHGEYVHEYALLAESPGSVAYRAAHGFQVDAFAVPEAIPGVLSLLEVESPNCLVEGVELADEGLLARVVNLSSKPVNSPVTGSLKPENARVRPDGKVQDGLLRLPARSVRELVFPSPRG